MVQRQWDQLGRRGATLHGAKPQLGFGILQCPTSGAIFRVIFESISNTDRVFDPDGVSKTSRDPQDAGRGASGEDDRL